MLHLLQPIWLLASAGIIIPIAIHLWNVKQGKVFKVGSIALLSRSVQQRARSLQVTEWWLLILRCLLIILLSLLLAKPYWQENNSRKGWVLMEKKDATEAYAHFKPLVDSLLQSGYEFHLFEKGFEKKDLQTFINGNTDTGSGFQSSYWKLLAQLDKQVSSGLPVYLFTGNRLTRFSGNRPEIAMTLTWKTFTQKDSTRRYISQAYLSAGDSIVVTLAETDPIRTIYHQQIIASDKPGQNDFIVSAANGNMFVSYRNNTPVMVDTTMLRITVFADTYMNDANYIKAAIQSIQQVSRRKIELRSINVSTGLPTKQDWLFWLSDKPVPQNIHANNLFIYQTGNPENSHSQMQVNEYTNDDALTLYKRIAYQQNHAEQIWHDGFGTPLLTKEKIGETNQFRSYSHFDPSWNELVWSVSFPQIIYGLIDNSVMKTQSDSLDQRIVDQSQLQLAATGKTNQAKENNSNSTTAQKIMWVLVFLVFCLERYYSFKEKKERVYA